MGLFPFSLVPQQMPDFHEALILVFLSVLTVVLCFYYFYWKVRSKELRVVLPHVPIFNDKRPHFRKRDRLRFWVSRMLRQAPVPAVLKDGTRKKMDPKQSMQNLIQYIKGRGRKKAPVRRRVAAIPDSILEPEDSVEQSETGLFHEFYLALKSVRVFGHLDKSFLLELCKALEIIHLSQGDNLFKIGDMDGDIFIVQRGKICLKITENGVEQAFHEVSSGGTIHSLLSFLDTLTGHGRPYKTLSAVALMDTTVLRIPALKIMTYFNNKEYENTLVRIVQIISTRLQRVTFLALNNYLGLKAELMNTDSQAWPECEVLKLQTRIKETSNCFKTLKSYSSVEPETHSTESDTVSVGVESTSAPTSSLIEQMEKTQMTDTSNNSDTPTIRLYSKRSRSQSQSRDLSPSTHSPHHQADLSDAEEKLNMNRASRVRIGSQRGLEFGEAPQRKSISIPINPKKISRISSHEDTDTFHEVMLEAAIKDLASIFCMTDLSLLKGRVSLATVKAHTTVVKQGIHSPNIFFMIYGKFSVQQSSAGSISMTTLYNVLPGELVGIMSVLTGEASLFTVRAEVDSHIAVITGRDFYALMRVRPLIALHVAHKMVRRMSPFLRQIDFALDWLFLESGKPLYKQGDVAHSVYIVLQGRLRQTYTTPSGSKELTGEFGRADWLGFLEVFTLRPRATTILAVRDTELAVIPVDLLNMIKRKHPLVVTRLIQLLSQKLLGSMMDNSEVRVTSSESYGLPMSNLHSVAIFPASDKVPVEAFTLELQHAVTAICTSIRLTSSIIIKRLGSNALDERNEYRLTSWLGQQEDTNRLVIYQCDNDKSIWTKRCLRQADCVVIVALATENPDILTRVKHVILPECSRVLNMLVLLHRETTMYPQVGRTADWLNKADEPLQNSRLVITQHLHIRVPRRVFIRRSSAKLLEMYKKMFQEPPDLMSDISRLARMLTGTAVGLVLGGGGARGFAHVGIIRALTENGIPIDMVGGTSMGAFMGALWAEETRYTKYEDRSRHFAVEMNCLWKKVLDLTYPQTAMFTGRAFNRAIEEVFKDANIEDLWIPYFCITTDITQSQMRVHSTGSVWRYVRASMSLSGYLPPLCDPENGNLLLDGGYVNNLPADVMKLKFAPTTIFAVDVGSQTETNLTNYGDELSGWWLLYKRLNPFAEKVYVPNLTEIQSRLAYVSCVRQLELVKSDGICEYMRPPIEKYATLQFGSFEEIVKTGYQYALDSIDKWKKQKKLPMFKRQVSHMTHISSVFPSANEDSMKFTDLAEMVCRIENPSLQQTSGNRLSSLPEMDLDHGIFDDQDYEQITWSDHEFDSGSENDYLQSHGRRFSDPEIFGADDEDDGLISEPEPNTTLKKRVKFREDPVRRQSFDSA